MRQELVRLRSLIKEQTELLAQKTTTPADWEMIRKDLLDLMDSDPNYDDGSYAPVFIRLAWHSSGTYNKMDNSGGSSGAGMRFTSGHEIKDPENSGLDLAISFLEPIRSKYPSISHSDLWVLAAYVAIEHTEGPYIEFKPGRKDFDSASQAPPNGRLPGAEHGCLEGLDDKVKPTFLLVC